jgi:hypothetical protein
MNLLNRDFNQLILFYYEIVSSWVKDVNEVKELIEEKISH